jgi:hypothetical protein
MYLFVIRGLPGSGKTAIAHKLVVNVYTDTQGAGHGGSTAKLICESNARLSLHSGRSCAVANPFLQGKDIHPYAEMAAKMDAQLIIVDLYDGGYSDEVLARRSGLSQETVARMRAEYQHDWRNSGI